MQQFRSIIMGLALGGAPLAAQAADGGDRVAFMPLGAISEAPRGFVEMCRTDQTFCAPITHGEQGDAALVTSALRPSAVAVPPHSPFIAASLFGPATKAARWSWTFMSMPNRKPASVWSLDVAHAGYDRKELDATILGDLAAGPQSLTTMSTLKPAAAPDVETASDSQASPAPIEDEVAARTELALLHRVNKLVNERVAQRTDLQIYGQAELWRRSGINPGAQGDCEDLAIEKRFELIDAGFAPKRMYFAVVYLPSAGLHTVLVARTSKGDVVLDSRTPYIERWDHTSYSWVSVQSVADPMQWHALGDRPSLIAKAGGAASPTA